jgi:hypothetical protein
MKWYLITWHESDGNDCTVYDSIVSAATEDDALTILGDALEAQLTANGTEFQEDGNHIGYYFSCSDDCTEDCEGHGGTSLRSVEVFDTEDVARANMARYHTEWTVAQ